MYVQEDAAKAAKGKGSARIQPVIEALVAFEAEVHRQVADLAARANAAEELLQRRAEVAAEADALIEEARQRAADIADQAAQDARQLIQRAQSEIDALQLASQQELIAAFRQYLQNIDKAQATLLRIARRALSALVADSGEESPPAEASQDPGRTPIVKSASDGDVAVAGRKPPAKRRSPARGRTDQVPREPEIDRPINGISETNGSHPATSPAFATSSARDEEAAPTSSPKRRRPPRSKPRGTEGAEPDPDHPKPGFSDYENAVATDVTVSAVTLSPQNLIDLRNRLDLERLDESNGSLTRVISRRRANGSTREP